MRPRHMVYLMGVDATAGFACVYATTACG